ncbi:VWA domain-containing protein [Cytobacillus solani]|uniref:vWA domain-containing protein n=1 Tax=Cytobacillus solani TaxID=1637975 RepID=UPI002079BD97|nr:VWA domain-containing protein [Cytobacillus solani]USK55547.1 VWA domain-containing protein [Cytobacillus solani]
MFKRTISMIAILLLILSGCSEKNETIKEKPEAEPEKAVEEEAGNVQKKDEVKKDSILTEIEAVKIPETIEDFANSQPGKLTSNFSYEKETASWPSLHTLEGIESELTEHLRSVAGETDDVDKLYQSLIYYIGNSAYPQVVKELLTFKPEFDEPYLPEPEQVSEETVQENAAPSKAIIMLDASSSMLLNVDGEQKMKIAKSAVRSFAKTIGSASEVSLYIYGHAGSQENKDKQLSCSTIDEVYPLQKYEEEGFYQAVDGVEAKGWTPLAGAIKKAYEVSQSLDGEITLYIVSDGAETCDGDPIAEAKQFVQGQENRKVNIIGFDVDVKQENQLKAVAEAGQGAYFSAKNTEELKSTVIQKWVPPGLIDIIGKQWSTPKGTFTVAWMNMDIHKMALKISDAINVEQGRFMGAANVMFAEGLITEAQKKNLIGKIEEHGERLKQLTNQLKEQKLKEIDDEVNRIDKKINDWAERMEQIRAENEQ